MTTAAHMAKMALMTADPDTLVDNLGLDGEARTLAMTQVKDLQMSDDVEVLVLSRTERETLELLVSFHEGTEDAPFDYEVFLAILAKLIRP